MPIWNPEFETMPRAELENLQVQRLQKLVERLKETSPFYKKKLGDKVSLPINRLTISSGCPSPRKAICADNYPLGCSPFH